MRPLFNLLYKAASWFILFPILLLLALLSRPLRRLRSVSSKPRLVWAGAPMPSLPAASQALNEAGYDSLSVANQLYPTNFAGQFDVVLSPKVRLVKGLNTPLYLLKSGWYFAYSFFTRDIYHTFFTGGILGNSPLASVESFLWRISGGKHILFPYGQDGFVYSELPDTEWAEALKKTYPRTRKVDNKFKRRIETLSKSADCVVGCIVHTVTLPRVDVWPVLWYPAGFKSAPPILMAGSIGTNALKIAHASNHREIKGTEIIIETVDRLKRQGYNIELDIIENVTTDVSRSRLAKADVVVDQILMGYAMAALEGLWLGKAVISGFDNSSMYEPFYQRSYLNECPILKATPSTLYNVIEDLYKNRSLIEDHGLKGRDYLNAYHSNQACSALFKSIYEVIWHDKIVDLQGLYKKA